MKEKIDALEARIAVMEDRIRELSRVIEVVKDAVGDVVAAGTPVASDFEATVRPKLRKPPNFRTMNQRGKR